MAKLRTLWRRFRRGADYVPLRWPGVLFAATGAFLLWFADTHADYLLYPASIVAIALLGLCMLCSTLGAIALRISLRRAVDETPEQIETTHIIRTGYRFSRLAWWPLVEVRMRWLEPPGIDVHLDPVGRHYEEVVTARDRGRHAKVVRLFRIEDIFGLTAIAFRTTTARALRIVPARCAQGPEVIVGHASGDAFSHPLGKAEGDLVEMRRYGHGDPLRHILWKTFARTRRLLVRMPERAISPQPTTSAYLVAGPGDEPAAATARLFVEAGLLGDDFVFAADGAPSITSDSAQAVEQIIDSVTMRERGGASLDLFRQNVEPVRLGRCIVFAPPIDGPWCDRVAAFSRTLPAPATVIIGVEGNAAIPRPPTRLARWLVRKPARGAYVPPDVVRVRARLEAGGMQVKILHRETGQVLQ